MLGRLVEKEVDMCFWEIVNYFSRFRIESGPYYIQSGKTITFSLFLVKYFNVEHYYVARAIFTFVFADYYTKHFPVYP